MGGSSRRKSLEHPDLCISTMCCALRARRIDTHAIVVVCVIWFCEAPCVKQGVCEHLAPVGEPSFWGMCCAVHSCVSCIHTSRGESICQELSVHTVACLLLCNVLAVVAALL